MKIGIRQYDSVTNIPIPSATHFVWKDIDDRWVEDQKCQEQQLENERWVLVIVTLL